MNELGMKVFVAKLDKRAVMGALGRMRIGCHGPKRP